MKKTLLALMALACTASAMDNTEINNSITLGLNDIAYANGDSYYITISGLNGGFSMTTGSDLKFGSQSNGGTQFISIAKTGITSYSWADSKQYTLTQNTSTPKATLTLSKEEAESGYWISPALSYNDGKYNINNGYTNNGVYSITLSYNKGDSFTTLSLVRQDGLPNSASNFTTIVIVEDWVIDASKINVTGGTAQSVKVSSIPEPTTATLSLLALAGLAARRRRASR